MSPAEFCARFKDATWLELVYKYCPPNYDRSWLSCLPEAIVTGSNEAGSNCRSKLKEDLTFDGTPSYAPPHTLPSRTAAALVVVLLGSLGYLQLFRAGYPARNALFLKDS
jgi:hypothetical protein